MRNPLVLVVFSIFYLSFSSLAFSKTYTYKLIPDDEAEEFLSFSLSLTGPFQKGSVVNKISISYSRATDEKEVLLFLWNEKDLEKHFVFEWFNQETLIISSYNESIFSKMPKDFTLNIGDAPLNSKDEHSLYTEDPFFLTEERSYAEEDGYALEILNQSEGESSFWGNLVKLRDVL